MDVDLTAVELLLVGGAGVAAGFVNAVAGGGTLISFPVLTAVGVPVVEANVTNTVALSPGYLGGTYAQRSDLEGQRARLQRLLPASVLGGIVGGALLLATSESVFESIVPVLILAACVLLALQPKVKAWVDRREAAVAAAGGAARPGPGPGGILAAFGAAVYGGYFGAGLGIVLLAVLGAVIDDDLIRVNALKQAVSFVVNLTASLFFVLSGRVVWSAALVMAVAALLGGMLGGRVASRLPADALRTVVVVLGVIVAALFALR